MAEQGGGVEVSALARGLAVLKVVGDAPGPLSNRELADATGIPKPTVSRLAATLVASGYLRQAPDSERFSLGPALLDMSNRYLRHFDLRGVARPHLLALAEFAGASVHLGVRDDLDMLIIDSLRPRSAMISSRIDVGSRMTIATSAAGRAYLAALPSGEQAELLDQIRLASGENWAVLEPRIMAGLEEHARLGYCSSFGEWHPHIHALGFSLRGPRGERYACSCGGPAYLLPRETMVARIAPKLLETLQRINADSGMASPAD
ncbi:MULTISPECIES: IclR family transcriptional regulator [unclassified Variovorax]|uniref:IclR family transcriptional regulator n=1 Tax=unclassified Variovorax TaxID=663243 RepID=UPI00076DB9A8|nr:MULTISPECIES: IclR family transcriptional regulator [unclassified Variovorax]KWT98799.1 Transcriptional regulator, IclR family [Variovorax sp. WDL1]PNG56137.1 HTH-type transcriptional regulator TsaQ1/TsaQ2 [Variovorax sp. B4]PNG57561.1 HTH-type transcriptional regulator TsaQ1/TsaQ2 [Variovorax sp. B2]VTV10038.1 Acetate operon repressor [Variovorax sp. WDL1]